MCVLGRQEEEEVGGGEMQEQIVFFSYVKDKHKCSILPTACEIFI